MIPTPTPFPDSGASLPVTIPDINAWEFADDAVQVWNTTQQFGLPTLIQAFLLILILSALIVLIIGMSKRISDDDK